MAPEIEADSASDSSLSCECGVLGILASRYVKAGGRYCDTRMCVCLCHGPKSALTQGWVLLAGYKVQKVYTGMR